MSNATTKEIFDAGIEMTKKAADRLAAVMEGCLLYTSPSPRD